MLFFVAGLQTAFAQGFRVYQNDGTVLQFSLKTDSVVFDSGLSGDEKFVCPFTPVNRCIARTWYKSKSKTVTFGADGTTDYVADATYEFMPYQGNIIIYNASGLPINILKVYKVTAEKMIVSSSDDSNLSVWSSTPEPVSHAWVDLGLPSGTKWATCNVGASSPEDYGDYFAWGETQPKSEYNWSTYFDTDDGGSTFKKYNNDGGLTGLEPVDDAATANWGSEWRTPSQVQIQELINSEYTTTEWTTLNDIYGYKITSKSNSNSIFLPAAGYYWYNNLYFTGTHGNYWSCSLYHYNDYTYYLRFNSSDIDCANNGGRSSGFTVRAVRCP